eukprot:CAMPEP_0170528080 /NCGR_PEP_ID=MMETSP0209-20121228/13575_1 /TAXON_ID=665100 ORGANISM="Litonotus pictus, Strain P1" /NCGR_SAMPLE_ID=MMETSP0209 /ASSEMBLY_ACC=CAM_ASM_000301 /LENGTH=316 /DNA_ID=CAMNT_0010819061 /DNA_START=392 /DNA_END=1342 /DNA_ORIENTATION=-
MKGYLKNNLFEAAFFNATQQVLNKLPAVHYQPHNNETNNRNNQGGSSFMTVFIIVLLAIGCIACCICCAWVKRNEEEISLSQPTDETVHIHMEKLLDIIKFKIKTVDPPITSIEQCVVCMEFLNPYWERDESTGNTNSNMFLTRFFCGHYYHATCLSRKNISDCLMCSGNQSQVSVEPSYRYFNTVSEDNIFSVIKNLDKIYPRYILNSYRENYKQDIVVVQEIYPSYNPGIIVWVDPMPIDGGYYRNDCYNNNYNNNYYPPPESNNYYTETTGGDYGGNRSYEMQNTTSGGDYGGGNDNTGGDYGGGDDNTGGDY